MANSMVGRAYGCSATRYPGVKSTNTASLLGGFQMVEINVVRLESDVEYIRKDVEELKSDVKAISNSVSSINSKLDKLATKNELSDLRGEMKAEISDLRGEMRLGFSEIRAEMKEFRHEIFSWIEARSRWKWGSLFVPIAAGLISAGATILVGYLK